MDYISLVASECNWVWNSGGLYIVGGKWLQLSAEHWWITYRWWQVSVTECGTLVDRYSHVKPLKSEKNLSIATLSTTNPTRVGLGNFRGKSATNRLSKELVTATKLRVVSRWSNSWNVWDRNIAIVSALATCLKAVHVLSKLYSGWRNRRVKLIAHVRLRFAVRTFSLLFMWGFAFDVSE